MVVLVCALALGGGCSAEEDAPEPSAAVPTATPADPPTTAEPTATPTPTPSPTATPSPTPEPSEATDEYAVPADPADIDEAYVQRVIDVMDELYGAAFHALYYDDAEFGDEAFVAPLQAGYTDPAFLAHVSVLELTREDDFPNVVKRPGARRRLVHQINVASPGCIHVVVSADFSEVAVRPPDDNLQPVRSLTMVSANELDDPENLNPTPWQVKAEDHLGAGSADARCED